MTTKPSRPDPQLELFDELRAVLMQRLRESLESHLSNVVRSTEAVRTQQHLREDWRYLCTALGERIVGHTELIRERLSIAALAHFHGFHTPQRILLCGPSGAGKSHIARVLAEVSDLPFRLQDAQRLQEPGWEGLHVEGMLERWRQETPGGILAIESGVICLDEIDKVSALQSPRAAEKARGEQASLLPLLGTGIPVSVGTEGAQMRPDRLLIVLTAAFSNMLWRHRAPTPRELVDDAGLIPELVDRLTEVIYVPPQPPELLARVYAEGPTAVSRAEVNLARALGYSLEIDPSTFRYAALLVSRGDLAVGQRTGGHWIAAAARRAIARALRDDQPAGTVIRVAPDDLEVPHLDPQAPSSRGFTDDDDDVPLGL